MFFLTAGLARAAPGPPPDPRKGERTDGKTRGRVNGRDVALAIPRLLLTPSRLVVGFIAQIARGALQLDHKHHIAAHFAKLLTSDDGLIGVHPILRYYTGFSPLGGFTFFDDRSLGPRSHLQISLAAGLPQLVQADVTVEPPLPAPYRLSISGHYVRRNDLLFAGIAQTSTGGLRANHGPRSRYGIDAVDVPVAFTAQVHRRVSLSAAETWGYRHYRDGREVGDDHAISRVYCPAELGGECRFPGVDSSRVPGFADGASFLATDAALVYDSRNNEAAPSHGVRFFLGGRYAHGVGRDESSWVHFRTALTGAIRLGHGSRVLVLRVAAEILQPIGSAAVPFTELVTLGGADNLRGWSFDRFRDYSSVLVTAEYRYAVWLGADATIFADWGGVFGKGFDGIRPDRMVPDVGVGLRIRTRASFLVRLQLAYGFGEGVQFLLATTTGL